MKQISNHKPTEPVWFELYTSHYRCTEVIKLLEAHNMEYFFPMHTEFIVLHGREIKKRVPSIPNTIFVHASGRELKDILNHSLFAGVRAINNGDKYEALRIPDEKMMNVVEICRHNDGNINISEIRKMLY